MSERTKWQARLAQAVRDLEELEHQLAEEEIPPLAAQRLQNIYLEEMEEARLRLTEDASAQGNGEAPAGPPRFWNTGRMMVAAILGVSALALVLSVGWFAQPEEQTAATEEFDPSRYSNETMEAVIAANADHPQINGMRLALAGRYFQAGTFRGLSPTIGGYWNAIRRRTRRRRL